MTRSRLLSLLFAVAAIALLVDGTRNWRDNTAFSSHGETAELQPVKDFETYAMYKRNGNPLGQDKFMGVFYEAELTYQTREGSMVTVPKRSLPPGLLEASKSGAPITIHYLPERPTTIRFGDEEEPAKSELLFGFVLLAAAAYYALRASR